MNELVFNKQELDVSERSSIMMEDLLSGKKIVHKMTNSGSDFFEIQDLYLNSLLEWYKHPKCAEILRSKGVCYGEDKE